MCGVQREIGWQASKHCAKHMFTKSACAHMPVQDMPYTSLPQPKPQELSAVIS